MSRLRLVHVASALACALMAGAGWAAEATAGPKWTSLTPQQQQTLAPLQRDWNTIDANRKLKWVELAARFPTLPADERQRVQARMADWAGLTPAQRATARLQFQQAQQIAPDERQERWKAYQALSPEQRKTLAQRAKPAVKGAVASSASATVSGATPASAARDTAASASAALSGKRNLVVPSAAVPSRVVTPTVTPMVVQARPGATTTNMTTRVAPPSHNQAGLPKIAATPGYVDRNTLLPRRGAQGAAVRAAASADPGDQP